MHFVYNVPVPPPPPLKPAASSYISCFVAGGSPNSCCHSNAHQQSSMGLRNPLDSAGHVSHGSLLMRSYQIARTSKNRLVSRSKINVATTNDGYYGPWGQRPMTSVFVRRRWECVHACVEHERGSSREEGPSQRRLIAFIDLETRSYSAPRIWR